MDASRWGSFKSQGPNLGQGTLDRDDLPYLLLGQHIRNHRLQLRQEAADRPWSQEDLAVAIGSDKAHVNRIECGRQSPTVDTLGRICDALDLAWPARRRLLGLAGFLKDLPEPRQDDIDKIDVLVGRALGGAEHPACLLDQDERIWDVNAEFAVVFLGFNSREACLAEISGRFLLDLLCEGHPVSGYLRRTLANFDQFALRLLAILRHAVQRRPAASQHQALLNDILDDPHLCSLWLQISANLNRTAPDYIDHQCIEVTASPLGPYAAELWYSSFRVDERFRVLHIVPTSDDARRRFAGFAGRRAGPEAPPVTVRAAGVAVESGAYPEGLIKLYVPWASGGVTDVGVRILTPLLQQRLGQPVSVVNCDNAQSYEALEALSNLPANGHHVVVINEPVLTNASARTAAALLHTARRPDLDRFDFLALHARDPFGVYVRPESRHGSLRDVLKDAASAPGKVIVGTSGRGTPAHLAALILEDAAGVRFAFRHYTGSLEHIARFLSGETHVACLGSGVSLPAVRAGEMRALAMLSQNRFQLMPDTQTLTESGYTGPSLASLRRICLPVGVDAAIRKRLLDELRQVMTMPEYVERMNAVGLSTEEHRE